MVNEFSFEAEIAGQVEVRRGKSLLWLPLVSVLPVAVAWFAIWFCYELIFVIRKEEELMIPYLALVIAVLFFGLAVGGPVSMLTSKVLSGSVLLQPAVMAVLLLVGVALGEVAYIIVSVLMEDSDVPITIIVRAVPEIIRHYGGGYVLLKVLFGGMLLLVGWVVIKEELKTSMGDDGSSDSNEQEDTGDLIDRNRLG